MKKAHYILLFFIISLSCNSKYPSVKTEDKKKPIKENVLSGLDVLEKEGFLSLKGKRIGLITNQTGINRNGQSAIDVIHNAPGVTLVRLFSPEHGIRGDRDEEVADSVDSKTGLKVISLYGRNKKPLPSQIEDLDALVYDIQDVGCRYYTYISTMAYCMKAAAENGKDFILLDRPNPVGCTKISGFIPPEEMTGSITTVYPIPTRYAMTAGELAKMFNEHYHIDCRLTVIGMKNYTRDMYWEDTGLKWVNPSPNMKTVNGAIIYAEMGWIETTSLSTARGTDIPFEMYGAPYIDNQALCEELKSFKLEGARIEPAEFVPTAKYHNYRNVNCYGIRIIIYDRNKFNGFEFGMKMTQTLMKMYPSKFKVSSGFKASIGSKEAEGFLKNGYDPIAYSNRAKLSLQQFYKIREKYLIY